MSTLKQIEANRANAQKSTGPRTFEGKITSSRNSTRHGLLAASVVLDGESVSRFHELINSLIAEFQPATRSEYLLVETMAVAGWRQMRIWGFERAAMNDEIHRREAEASPDDPPADRNTNASRAFQSLSQNSRTLDVMTRYENSYARMYNRCRDRLKKQLGRPAQQLPSQVAAQPSQEAAPKPETP